jgi:hypothetical protein
MKRYLPSACILSILMLFISCGRTDYAEQLVGTWHWTGDACDKDGSCRTEIMTDDQNVERFTADGMHITARSRNSYKLRGATIHFTSTSSSCGTMEAEIISLARDMLLLECGPSIHRYERVRNR